MAVAIMAVVGTLSGCGAAQRHRAGHGFDAALGFWTRNRLLGALPWRGVPVLPRPTPTARTRRASLQTSKVGAIFSTGSGGNHFCTASVVASPKRDLLITAAHCISAGKNGGYQKNIVFIPGYRNGTAPHGVWTPRQLFVAPQWVSSSDPDYDVGFVVLNSRGGQNIQDVLGANRLNFNPGYRTLVRVTGYPNSADAPVACRNWTAEQSPTQLRFDCAGLYDGTSGSPFVAGFDPLTGTGTIIGVVGGYQGGGDTDSVSYSSYLGTAGIQQLYRQAVAAG